MLQYHGHPLHQAAQPMPRTEFERRLHRLDHRITMPAWLKWEVIFREYRIEVGMPLNSLWVLQVADLQGTDNVTGEPMVWRGRRWMLSQHMTDMEIANTALMATLSAVEHEVRETLTVSGAEVFNPHRDLEAAVRFARFKGSFRERD